MLVRAGVVRGLVEQRVGGEDQPGPVNPPEE